MSSVKRIWTRPTTHKGTEQNSKCWLKEHWGFKTTNVVAVKTLAPQR